MPSSLTQQSAYFGSKPRALFLGGFALGLIWLAGLLWYGNRQEAKQNRLLSHTHQVLLAANQMLALAEQERGALRGYILFYPDTLATEHEEVQVQLRRQLATLQQLEATEPRIKPYLDTLQYHLTRREQFVVGVKALVGQDQRKAAATLASEYRWKVGRFGPALICKRLIAAQQDLYRATQQTLTRSVERTNTLALITELVLAALALCFGWYTWRGAWQEQVRNKKYLQQFFNTLQTGLVQVDLQGRIMEWNPEATRLLGYSEQEALGQDAETLVELRHLNKTKAEKIAELKANGICSSLVSMRHRQGHRVHMYDTAVLHYNNKGVADGTLIQFQDISDYLGKEEALSAQISELNQSLSENKAQYQVLVESVTDAIFTLNKDWQIGYANDIACRLWQVPAAEAGGRHLLQVLAESGTTPDTSLVALYETALNEGKEGYLEYTDAQQGLTYATSCFPSAEGITIIQKDITRRWQAEQENNQLFRQLHERELQYHLLLDSVTDGVFAIDTRWAIRFANPTFAAYFNLEIKDILGSDFRTLYAPLLDPERQPLYDALEGALLYEQPGFVEQKDVDGKVYAIRIYPVDGGGASVIYREITTEYQDRQQVVQLSEALTANNERYATLVEAITDGFFSIDRNWRFTYINAAMAAYFDRTPETTVGRHLYMVWPFIFQDIGFADLYLLLNKGVKEGKGGYAELGELPGKIYGMYAYPSADGISVLFRDVTGQKKAGQQIVQLKAQLQQQLDQHMAMMDAVKDGVWSLDKNWCVTYANPAAETLYGRPAARLLGQDFRTLEPHFHHPAYDATRNILAHALQTGEDGFTEQQTPDGRCFATWCYAYEKGIMVVSKDITEQRRSERERQQLSAELQAQNNQYQDLVNAITDGFFSLDREWRYQIVNQELLNNHGLPREAVIGKKIGEVWTTYLHPRSLPLRQLLDAAMHAGVTGYMRWEDPVLHRSFDVWVYPTHTGISVMYRDQTEHYRAEDEKLLLQQQVEALNQDMQRAREEERQHLSRELHDELGQQLTGIKIGIALLLRRLEAKAPELCETGAEITGQVNHSINTVRQLARELRPAMLDDLGLEQALRQHATQFEQRSGIAVQFSMEGNPAMPPSRSIHLYRIFQEALTNIMRHAEASSVTINLHCAETHILLHIADNGKGIATGAGKNSLGLRGMQERARILGATLRIGAGSGGGTLLELNAPLYSAEELN